MNITNEQKDIFMTLDEQILYLNGIINAQKHYNDDYDILVMKNIRRSLERYKFNLNYTKNKNNDI